MVSSIRDLGVCLTSDLKISAFYFSIAVMTFNMCSCLLKGFHSTDVLSLCG